MAKEYLIGDFLKRIKRPIDLEPNQDYKLVTIKMNHKGVVLRGSKKGSDIKSKMFQVKEGDFILSGIDARNGAFGIVPNELEGAIVTNDFWYFDIDEDIILNQLFLELTTMSWFDEICRKGSDGTTQRIRLQKSKFFNQKVLLPEADEQKELLAKILNFKKGQKALNLQIEFQNNKISNLRQSILQEAVQGKLTADWRSSHPELVEGSHHASNLLKRIQEEKAQLIADKKIKKEKALPPITKEDIPYELPKGWVWCRLGNILLYSDSGKSPNCEKRPVIEKEWGVLTTTAVQQNRFVEIANKVLPVNYEINPKQVVEVGDILITRAGPINRTGISCKVDKLNFNLILSDKTIRLKYLNDLLFPDFIVLALNSDSIRKLLLDKMIGMASSQVNISQANIKGICFPLAPLEEQKAIVEKVNSLMGLCDALEQEVQQSQQHSEMMMQSVLKEVFEGRS
ncbi:restriction endonuclease subunit S [Nonlabens sp. Asnod3-H03]|uniref:restriction endonuclease subunit S n=1 Tax=Nonlabens sp. Asnod3-H03 TaxID=3160580 RepID=UPI00386774DD